MDRVKKQKVSEDFDGDISLELSLSTTSSAPSPPLQHEVIFHSPLLPSQLRDPSPTPVAVAAIRKHQGYAPQRTGRTRRSPQSSNSKNENIRPPFPWATNKRAMVHSLEYLRANKMKKISGQVQCKKCNARSNHEFDLEEKFKEVADFIWRNKETMRDRAPKCWLSPDLPACNHCGQANSLKPVMPESKEEINWLFLLLGQMLGFCTLEQLKYFCQHTKNHRTGAKDRVLFLTFLGLCKQLDPKGPFDR